MIITLLYYIIHTDYENKYRKLIKKMLYTHYYDLKCCLDGLDAFTDRMISSNLIAARSRYKSFDEIMSEFQDKLQSSRSVTTIYDTFVDTLKEFYENFNELRINWSVKSSVLSKTSVHQVRMTVYRSVVCMTCLQ